MIDAGVEVVALRDPLRLGSVAGSSTGQRMRGCSTRHSPPAPW